MVQKAFPSFDKLMGGAVYERLDGELAAVFENIYDMRTPATKARTVTLRITVKPNAQREIAAILYDVKSSPAPAQALEQTVFMRQRDDGTIQITEHTNQVPGQMDMDGGAAPLPNVVEFKPAAGKQ